MPICGVWHRRTLPAVFFADHRDNIDADKHRHDYEDHNGRKGIDCRIDALGHIIDNDGNIFYAIA